MRDPRTFVNRSAGPPRLRHPVGDLGDLEVRIDLGRHLDKLALPAQMVDPVAQVVEGHGRASLTGRRLVASQSARCGLSRIRRPALAGAHRGRGAPWWRCSRSRRSRRAADGRLDARRRDRPLASCRPPRSDRRRGRRADADPAGAGRRALHVRPDLPPRELDPEMRQRHEGRAHPGRGRGRRSAWRLLAYWIAHGAEPASASCTCETRSPASPARCTGAAAAATGTPARIGHLEHRLDAAVVSIWVALAAAAAFLMSCAPATSPRAAPSARTAPRGPRTPGRISTACGASATRAGR